MDIKKQPQQHSRQQRMTTPGQAWGNRSQDTDQPARQRSTRTQLAQQGPFLIELIKIFLLALVIIWPVRTFLFQPFLVKGDSMLPTFETRDYLIVGKFGYKRTDIGLGDAVFTIAPHKTAERGQVIIFRAPSKKDFFIKRVIGLPGEEVEIRDGKVILYTLDEPDGMFLDESAYLAADVQTSCSGNCRHRVGTDEYFVLGDNRVNSTDSRVIGTIHKDEVIGTALLRAWPLSEFDVF